MQTENEALSNLAKNSLYFKSQTMRSGRQTFKSTNTLKTGTHLAHSETMRLGDDFKSHTDKIMSSVGKGTPLADQANLKAKMIAPSLDEI